MAFMISRETENVRSAKEVEDAFRAITDGGKQPFVTEEELYQVDALVYNTSYNIFFEIHAGLYSFNSESIRIEAHCVRLAENYLPKYSILKFGFRLINWERGC